MTHGPLTEKNYARKVNKKMAKKALWTVLSAKARDKEIVVLEDLKFSEPKTKLAAQTFKNLAKNKELSRLTGRNGILLALPAKDGALRRAVRNLPYAVIEEVRNLNVYKVLQHKYLVMPQKAIEVFKTK